MFVPPTEPSAIESDTSFGSKVKVVLLTIEWFAGIPMSKYILEDERLELVKLFRVTSTLVADQLLIVWSYPLTLNSVWDASPVKFSPMTANTH